MKYSWEEKAMKDSASQVCTACLKTLNNLAEFNISETKRVFLSIVLYISSTSLDYIWMHLVITVISTSQITYFSHSKQCFNLIVRRQKIQNPSSHHCKGYGIFQLEGELAIKVTSAKQNNQMHLTSK